MLCILFCRYDENNSSYTGLSVRLLIAIDRPAWRNAIVASFYRRRMENLARFPEMADDEEIKVNVMMTVSH